MISGAGGYETEYEEKADIPTHSLGFNSFKKYVVWRRYGETNSSHYTQKVMMTGKIKRITII